MAERRGDGEGKTALKDWPCATTVWSSSEEPYLRAQPVDGAGTGPFFAPPGTPASEKSGRTQPDGLWVRLSADADYAEAIVVEVCTSLPNFYDKRSRYMASPVSTLLLYVPQDWLGHSISYKSGKRARHEFFGIDDPPSETVVAPLRFLRAVYALPNEHYKDWAARHAPLGHEFFIPHSCLDSFTSQQMQRFFRGMRAKNHFYSQP